MALSLSKKLQLSLEKKRLIFTVTTGRSGTGYLSKALSFLPNVASYHEPEPSFSNVMRLAQKNANIAYEFWVDKKLPHIASVPAQVYIETSHLFCKGFVEPLLELGFTPDIIILTRPHREVATSMYQLDTIPGLTDKGLRYYLSPDDPNVLPLPGWHTLHDYQLCYWYCLEIERRSVHYEKMFLERGARVAKTSLNDITTVLGFHRLVMQLDLPRLGPVGWLRYFRNRVQKVNVKGHKKRPLLLPDLIDILEEQVINLVQKAQTS